MSTNDTAGKENAGPRIGTGRAQTQGSSRLWLRGTVRDRPLKLEEQRLAFLASQQRQVKTSNKWRRPHLKKAELNETRTVQMNMASMNWAGAAATAYSGIERSNRRQVNSEYRSPSRATDGQPSSRQPRAGYATITPIQRDHGSQRQPRRDGRGLPRIALGQDPTTPQAATTEIGQSLSGLEKVYGHNGEPTPDLDTPEKEGAPWELPTVLRTKGTGRPGKVLPPGELREGHGGVRDSGEALRAHFRIGASRQAKPPVRAIISKRKAACTPIPANTSDASAMRNLLTKSMCPTRLNLHHHAGGLIDAFGNKVKHVPAALAATSKHHTPTRVTNNTSPLHLAPSSSKQNTITQQSEGQLRPSMPSVLAAPTGTRHQQQFLLFPQPSRLSKVYKEVDLTAVQEKLREEEEIVRRQKEERRQREEEERRSEMMLYRL